MKRKIGDFRPTSVAQGEPLLPEVTIFAVHRELFRVFTDRERHTDHELHG